MVSLTGTGRLADDVYLLAHHEVSGRPFSTPALSDWDWLGPCWPSWSWRKAISATPAGVGAPQLPLAIAGRSQKRTLQ